MPLISPFRLRAQRLGLVAALLLASTSLAAQSVRPDQAIEYRQSVYQVILWNFQPLGAMARGRIPFDRTTFRRHAQRLANLSGHLLEGFPEGSDSGAETAAKSEIWENWADFESKMNDFRKASRELAVASRTEDFEALKTRFGAVGGTCKACHDSYKID